MSDLSYLNARVRAMRGRLLARADYERLLASPGPTEIAAALRETSYGPFLDSFDGKASWAERAEEALRRNFEKTASGLLAMSAGDCREGMQLLLEIPEVAAIKTILRGKAARLPASEILGAIVPTGLHGEAALQELCRQPNVRAVADLLTTWRDPWGVPLSRAMSEYREPKDLFVLESALDRFRADRAAKRLRAMPRPHRGNESEDALCLFLSLSVDRVNLATALKAVDERIPPEECRRHFLPGGRACREKEFEEILSSKSLPEAIGRAATSPFARALGSLPPASVEIPVLAAVERQLDGALLGAMKLPIRRDPLGWGPPSGYLLEKTLEIRNVRMIVRGKRAGIPDSELKELLVLEA